jgi:hypothetical protein
VIVTQEDDFVVTLVDVATHRITWRYGTPGVHGVGPNQLWNPDDAMVLPNRQVLIPDIKNCRIILVGPGQHAPLMQLGDGSSACVHRPPKRYGSPNGMFPMRNGHYLLTEINGDWVSEIDLSGKIYWSTHAPGLGYPSDSNEIEPGRYLSVDYRNPGTIETFDKNGRVLWRYRPAAGAQPLNRPSLALPLPNGDIICNDDFNHRVIVVDPRTNQIVWQYGQTGVSGRTPGLLNIPDGIDLAHPASLLAAHVDTMGTLP